VISAVGTSRWFVAPHQNAELPVDSGEVRAWADDQLINAERPMRSGHYAGLAGSRMPTISSFYGILIQMFWRDHAPPHFHALYAEHEAHIDIRTLEVIEGGLPKRALALVLEWAVEHRRELMEDWNLCARMQMPKKIAPLS
jgi:hypothetical protein